jgi:5'(3')-deoxyribonucleotidase
MKKTLLLDCDGVICDCSAPIHRFAENLLGRPLPAPEDWKCWDHTKAMNMSAAEAQAFHRYIIHSGVAQQIELFPDALQQVCALTEKYDVVFVTSHWRYYPDWVPCRERLLDRFDLPIVFTHHKHLVHGHVLCDDNPENLTKFSGEVRLFDAPHNRSSGIKRILSLEELL